MMLDLGGSIRPAIYLACELVERGHDVSIMSLLMSDHVERQMHVLGIEPINLRANLVARHSSFSYQWFETWLREALLSLNSRRAGKSPPITVNFSQVFSLPSQAWYLQGPPSVALKEMVSEFSAALRIAHRLVRPLVMYADKRLIGRMSKNSRMLIANSKSCASIYRGLGVGVQDVIYPPIDREIFRPAENTSSSYVLTYFGKETVFSAIKRVADYGIKIKAFGSKSPYIPRQLMNHPNVDLLGRVSTSELVHLYSDALFTLFPFTHEPFGYIPLESIACGTPVLTFNKQGPSEYIQEDLTGWLANNEETMVKKAVKLWGSGYPSEMRTKCVEASSMFDKTQYVKRWMEKISFS